MDLSEESGKKRNRSQGWLHAKKSGHDNETIFGEVLKGDSGFVKLLEVKKYSTESPNVPTITVDGSKKVPSIFGDLTTSKVDLEIDWGSKRLVGVSVKKSSGGQAWLISVDRFIRSLEHYLGSPLGGEIRLGLSLFIGGANLGPYTEKFEKALSQDKVSRPVVQRQEERQGRLVAESIKSNFPGVLEALIGCFSDNIELITALTFSRGLAKSSSDWADFVIYNLADEGQRVFLLDELVSNAASSLSSLAIHPGPKNGGSTIMFPTGFMQMHHPGGENLIQFHHSFAKVLAITSND